MDENQERKGLNCIISYLRHADEPLKSLFLDEITKNRLMTLLRDYRATGVKNSTENNLIVIIRTILNAAKSWGWLDIILPVTERRLRWFTRDEADRLLRELPDHLKPMVKFSLATGLRKQNVALLEWNQVDLERRVAWIYADQAKGKRVITVPLNADALVVLREQIGQHPTRVFTYEGNPVTRANNHAWRKATQRAGIDNFRWHDLRHTWASWHVQAGTPLMVLKELGGWATLEMVLRYAHLGADHLAEHAERIARPRIVRTNSGTAIKNALPQIVARR